MKKRHIILTIASVLPIASYGASMCVPSNVYVAVLAPERDGVSAVSNGDGTFTITFDYVTGAVGTSTTNNILGVASCNTIVGTTDSTAGNISASASDVGTYCWCALSKPVVTGWGYTGENYASEADCAANCVNKCIDKIKLSSAFRTAIYGAIW